MYQYESSYTLTPPFDLLLFPLKLIEDILSAYVVASTMMDTAPDARQPLTMDAWFSASDTIKSPGREPNVAVSSRSSFFVRSVERACS